MPDIFAVIADATRRDLLRVLLDASTSTDTANADISVGEMVTALGVSQPTVSKHLRVLREAGLVRVREEGQHRYYSVEPAPLEAVEDWLIPFVSVDTLTADVLTSTPFAAWAGASMPAPLRRAAENLPDAEDVGSTLGRYVAGAQHRASSALHDAQSALGALDERVIDPVRKRLGRSAP